MYIRVRWYHMAAFLALAVILLSGVKLFSDYAIRVDLTIPDRGFPDSGQVEGIICNVFGDSLPGVSVTLAGKHTVTGENGEFHFSRIPMGMQKIILESEGYAGISRMVRIDAGPNFLELKYDDGMFPNQFSLDFHIYYTEGSLQQGRCFGEIGIANGAKENYYVLELVVYNPLGVETLNLLKSEDNFREISGTLSDSNFVSKPRMAVFYQPRTYFTINLPPLANPIAGGIYTLKCVYASQIQWEAGVATMEVLESQCVLDDDWNPHT